MINRYILLNPNYILKPDLGRALILSKEVGRKQLPYVPDSFETFVHPLYAQILCFVDGSEINMICERASAYLNVSSKMIMCFIEKLIDNSSFVKASSKMGDSTFPPYTIVTTDGKQVDQRYMGFFEQFKPSNVCLKLKRHYTPTALTLMVNNHCVTDCFYCYEDKSKKMDCQIPFERIKQLIEEARDLNVRSIDVIGGEFFLYENWEQLISVLHENDFHPYLSTKMPIEEAVVRKLAELHIQDIQVSLDTLIEEHQCSILKVASSYKTKIKETLLLLDKYHIKTMIHSVISQRSHDVEDIKSVYDFIKNLTNISQWKLDRAGKSFYTKVDYAEIKPDESQILKIIDYLDTIMEEAPFPIRNLRPSIPNAVFSKQQGESSFFDRGLCSGNYSSFFILPDGQVTICEELYWKPHFIIGNVLEQNIVDIWNSNKAMDLFYVKQENMPNDSLCSSCDEFDICRSIRHVCWREVLKKFGDNKWYYPDPGCPKLQEN